MEKLTLKSVLSISGRPGLFKLVAQGKNMLIVESLADQKRQPAYAKDKVVSLSDVAIFTEDGEMPLNEILTSVFEKEQGKEVNINPKTSKEDLIKYFEEVLPNFDKDRVYPTDIKKVIKWYNILIKEGFTDFNIGNEESEKEKSNEIKKEVKKETSNKETKTTSKATTSKAKATKTISRTTSRGK